MRRQFVGWLVLVAVAGTVLVLGQQGLPYISSWVRQSGLLGASSADDLRDIIGAGTGSAASPRGVLTHAGTVTLDYSAATVQKLVLTGAVTIAFSNLETNRTFDLLIANPQATNCNITLPTNLAMGFIPTYITAGKHGRFWFEVDCQTNSVVYATYAEQP
jgi:hypothetical protein